MMMTRHVGIRLLAPVFLSVACGCCSSPLHVSESVFPGNLVGDAHRTYAAYVKAADGTGEQTETEIPREYWEIGRAHV